MNIAVTVNEPNLIAIDPRPCGLCGLTIDRHILVDLDEGPEHFCPDLDPDEMTLDELERRAELRNQEAEAAIVERWERADPRDRWRHTGAPPPPPEVRNGPVEPPRDASPHRPSASTVDAVRDFVAAGDTDRLKAWLAARPNRAPFLIGMLERTTS